MKFLFFLAVPITGGVIALLVSPVPLAFPFNVIAFCIGAFTLTSVFVIGNSGGAI
jgi:hypothetical protein